MRSPRLALTRLMNRAEHLKQHEDRAGKRERTGERIAALHGADEHAHRDRERRRQDPSQQEDRPPSGGEARVRLREDAEELPFLALGQSLEHDRILPQNRCVHRLAPCTTIWLRMQESPQRKNSEMRADFRPLRITNPLVESLKLDCLLWCCHSSVTAIRAGRTAR